MKTIKALIAGLCSVREGPRTVTSIIWWWELRRIPYNLIVGFCGIVSLSIMVPHLMHHPEADAEPLFYAFGAAITANLLYTGGWIVEILLRSFVGDGSRRFARYAFCAGLGFSVFVALAPGALSAAVQVLEALHVIR